MRWTIRRKLGVTFVGALLLGLAVAALTVILPLVFWLEHAGDDAYGPVRAEEAARQHAAAVEATLRTGEAPAALRLAAVPSDLPVAGRVQVVTRQGQVVVDTGDQTGRILTAEEALAWGEAAEPTAEPAELVQMRPLYREGALWGYYRLTVPSPALLSNPAAGRQTGWLMLGGLALMLTVTLSLFAFFSLHLERPIRLLSDAIHRIAGGDLTVRVRPGSRSDELGQLARDLDAMAGSLQQAREQARTAEEAHRYLVAAASHDLRTPLTALLAHAEALRAGIATDPARSIALVEEKGLQLKRLTDDLFELAALDAAQEPWTRVRTDLAELVRSEVAGVLPALEEAGMAVDAQIPDEPVWADLAPGRIQRVMDNLLANGLKYGAPGGWLSVTVTPTAKRVRVEVADRGPGIPALEQGLIFHRFYRGDAARSRAGGSGLGLAIAREIVLRHGGAIGVTDRPEGGACFWFELPTS